MGPRQMMFIGFWAWGMLFFIFGGTRYLSLMLERFKNDLRLALGAYNAGPERIDEHNGLPPFPETKSFVEKVLRYYKEYSSGKR